MYKIVKSKLFIGFMIVFCILAVWQVVVGHYVNKRITEIKQEFAEEQEKFGDDRPLPDSIYLLPEAAVISGKRTYFGTVDENLRIKEANALLINKRDGVYYWDSNGKKPLTVVTKVKRSPSGNINRKASIFTAEDGSGSIVIWHDILSTKGGCHHIDQQPNSFYIEERVNEDRKLSGWSRFFPPRPDDWCKPFHERLREEGLIVDMKEIFTLRGEKK